MDKSKEAEGPVKRGLSAKIRRLERRSADWLEKSTSHFTKKTWAILLALFIMLGAAISGMLLIGGLTGQLENAFNLYRITKSINTPTVGNETTSREGLTKAEFDKLLHYQTYLDSLQKSPEGRKRYQQIQKQHPGLPDSLNTIIKTYQSQFKTK